MKQSVVKYVKLVNDQIKIVGFENVAGLTKLGREFGAEAAEAYTAEGPWYIKLNQRTISVNDNEFHIDQVIPRETFQQMISTMKVAGNRLMTIKGKVDNTVREVKI